jgi:hypothetical protein
MPSWPSGRQQSTAQQDQAGNDQQGRQSMAASRPDRAAADPDHDLEEHRQDQEGDLTLGPLPAPGGRSWVTRPLAPTKGRAG